MSKKPALNPHFPTGTKSIVLENLPEDTWWVLMFVLKVRIDFHKQMRCQLEKLNAEDLQGQIDCHIDTQTRMLDLLESIQTQIAPKYWTADKRRRYREDRLSSSYS